MDLALIQQGFFIMVIGMGTVFFFLTIMTFAMDISGKFISYINKFFPEEIPEAKKPTRKNTQNEDEAIALAIACAVAKRNKSVA